MKKVLCVLCLLLSIQLFPSDVFGYGRVSWGKDNRSVSLPLHGSIEGDVLYIYSEFPLENVTIRIYDENGQDVYKDFIQESSIQSYCLSLSDFLPGKYILEINEEKRAEIFYEL